MAGWGAGDVRSANGGTPYVLYRKDRMEILSRAGPARAVPAGAGSLYDAAGGGALLQYANAARISGRALGEPLCGAVARGARPGLKLRTVTGDRPASAPPLDDAVPAGGLATVGFYGQLLLAWIAMGLKSPPLAAELPEMDVPAMGAGGGSGAGAAGDTR